jgi:hypothetical protein
MTSWRRIIRFVAAGRTDAVGKFGPALTNQSIILVLLNLRVCILKRLWLPRVRGNEIASRLGRPVRRAAELDHQGQFTHFSGTWSQLAQPGLVSGCSRLAADSLSVLSN